MLENGIEQDTDEILKNIGLETDEADEEDSSEEKIKNFQEHYNATPEDENNSKSNTKATRKPRARKTL